MTLTLWILVMGFALGSALFDVRTRHIPNAWNLGGLAVFLLWHAGTGTLWASVLSSISVGAVWLIPAVKGWSGVGDMKMAAALGAALGIVPGILATGIGFWWLAAPGIRRLVYGLGPGTLAVERMRGVPVAVGFFLGVLTVGGVLLLGARFLG
ncbi:MAG: prepilin peptidase [Bacilli bacterium]